MPSFGTLKADTLTHSTAGSVTTDNVVNGSAKAFSHFDGTSDTIKKSFNQSSLTDVGTGQYKQTYTNALSDAHQVVTTNGARDSDQQVTNRFGDNATTHHQVNSLANGTATRQDTNTAMSVALGDLA